MRKDKGYTGKELASQLNLSQQKISRYERGDNQLTIDVLFNVFIILDVSLPSFINYLFDEIVLNHPDNLDVVRLKIEPIDSIFLIWDKKY
ncbi:helix-turn-helix domain-containing protein [Providencia rettgeri]